MFYNIKKSGERIRQLCKQKKYTQIELAEKLNIDRSVLSRIEIGKYTCSVELLAQMSSLFDVSLDYLVLGKECTKDTVRLKESIQELIQHLEHFKKAI